MGIDYVKIGRRMTEERKHFKKVSQEKMAEELGMYQADISNLERAKNGSGIYDLKKLEMIADYFGISIENLLFGTTEEAHMVSYGHNLELKKYTGTKFKTKKQTESLTRMLGEDASKIRGWFAYEYGPLICYALPHVETLDNVKGWEGFHITRYYMYLFYDDTCVVNMVTDDALMETAVCFPKTYALSMIIPQTVLDPVNALRTLDPYIILEQFEDDDSKSQHYDCLRLQRMNELSDYLEDTALYVENVYVAEDYRRHGYCRLLFDILKKQFGDVVIWVNMEPAPSEEFKNAPGKWPMISMDDVEQIKLNAIIAQHLGFSVDPDDWHRNVEVTGSNGRKEVRNILVRKIAHYLPHHIQKIVEDDGDLVALGYAMQKEKQSKEKKNEARFLYAGRVEDDAFCVATDVLEGGRRISLFIVSDRDGSNLRYYISNQNPIEFGLKNVEITKRFGSVDEMKGSKHEEDFLMLQQQLKEKIKEFYPDENKKGEEVMNGEEDKNQKEPTAVNVPGTKSGYRIAELRAGFYEGIACGPMGPTNIAEAAIIDNDGEICCITITEFEGYVNGYSAEKSSMDYVLKFFEEVNGSPEQEKCRRFLEDHLVFTTDSGEDIREYTKDDEFDKLYQFLFYVAVNQPYDDEAEKQYNKDLEKYKGMDPMEIDVPENTFDYLEDYDDLDEEDDEDNEEKEQN